MNFTVWEVKMLRLNSVAAHCSGGASVKSGKGNFNVRLVNEHSSLFIRANTLSFHQYSVTKHGLVPQLCLHLLWPGLSDTF